MVRDIAQEATVLTGGWPQRIEPPVAELDAPEMFAIVAHLTSFCDTMGIELTATTDEAGIERVVVIPRSDRRGIFADFRPFPVEFDDAIHRPGSIGRGGYFIPEVQV